MMCQVTLMSRTFSTSRIHREVIQANGQRGSNQKSAFVMTCTTPRGARGFPKKGHGDAANPGTFGPARPPAQPTSERPRPTRAHTPSVRSTDQRSLKTSTSASAVTTNEVHTYDDHTGTTTATGPAVSVVVAEKRVCTAK